MLEQVVWRGMPYFDVFWRKRHLTRRDLRAVYANYYSYVYLLLMASLIVLLDLHGFSERVSLTAMAAYSISLAVTTLTFYVLAALIGLAFSRRYSRFFMIAPFVGFTAITISTYIVELGMSGYFGAGISLEHAAEKLPVNLILTLVLETLYITFVLPIAVRDSEKEEIQASHGLENAPETLSIAGKTFFCDQLLSVSSQDHYVRILTHDGESVVRARLSDLIGQLDTQNGIQPHRSHWVARGAVHGIACRDGHKYLELNDGSEVPIARGRMIEVQEWLEI
ncbi:MAG: LytTR family transcriptional regulator [Rhodobacteraceae bacterium]|nr:LytTR family transcriptional regulator [Paracoccaceae bacterium]